MSRSLNLARFKNQIVQEENELVIDLKESGKIVNFRATGANTASIAIEFDDSNNTKIANKMVVSGNLTYKGFSNQKSSITPFTSGFVTGGLISDPGSYSYIAATDIQKINITTPASTTNFSDLSASRYLIAGVTNGTTGLVFGGRNGVTGYPNRFSYWENTIQQFSLTSGATATSFGVLTRDNACNSGMSDMSRGVISAGYTYITYQSVTWLYDRMEYVTIGTPGNATIFGQSNAYQSGTTAASDFSMRGFIIPSEEPLVNTGSTHQNSYIEYITIPTAGNALAFSELFSTITTFYGNTMVGNDLRMVFINKGNIRYFSTTTINSSVNFGNMGDTVRGRFGMSDMSNSGFLSGGQSNDNWSFVPVNEILRINIMSPGTTTDFGDLITPICSGASNIMS